MRRCLGGRDVVGVALQGCTLTHAVHNAEKLKLIGLTLAWLVELYDLLTISFKVIMDVTRPRNIPIT